MIKCVIFDFDGVLVDSQRIISSIFTGIVNKELSLGATEDDFMKHPGMRLEQKLHLLAMEKGKPITTEERDRVTLIGRDAYLKKASRKSKLYPGVTQLLETLKNNGIIIALGSNGPREAINSILISTGIMKYFAVLVTFDDVLHGKPAPDIFNKISIDLKLKKDECVVVEDSVEGVKASKAAGMKVVAILSTSDRDRLIGADIIVQTIKDINMQKLQALQ